MNYDLDRDYKGRKSQSPGWVTGLINLCLAVILMALTVAVTYRLLAWAFGWGVPL